MSQPPRHRTLSVTDLKSTKPEEQIPELLELISGALADSSHGLNKGLSLNDNLNVIEKTFRITTPAQQWIKVSGTGAPAFENSWVNYDTGANSLARFRIDDDGVVHMTGVVKSGSGIPTAIFTLPPGYRPDGKLSFSCASNGAFGYFSVATTGIVTAEVGNTTWFALDAQWSATQPAPTPAFSGTDWPLLVDSGKLGVIQAVQLVSIQDSAGGSTYSHGGCALHWEPGPAGKILVRRITRLAPSRSYTVKVLLYPK